MALVNSQFCNFCKKEQQHLNDKCVPCAIRLSREKWANWNTLDTDTKINQLLERIEKLESGAPKY